MTLTKCELTLTLRILKEQLEGMNSGWFEGSLKESEDLKSLISKLEQVQSK